MKRLLVVLLLLMLLLNLGVSCSTQSIATTGEQLFSAYINNEIKADMTYKDNAVKVTDRMIDIGRDGNGKAYLLLKTSYQSAQVCCYFSHKNEGDLSDIRYNALVSVVGKCQGLNWQGFVTVEDCQIDKVWSTE